MSSDLWSLGCLIRCKEGRKQGSQEGSQGRKLRKEVKEAGSQEARKQGSKARKQGRKLRKEARDSGSKETRKQGSKKARKQGRKAGRKEARKQGSKQEGRKEGREGGRKGGRKEGVKCSARVTILASSTNHDREVGVNRIGNVCFSTALNHSRQGRGNVSHSCARFVWTCKRNVNRG